MLSDLFFTLVLEPPAAIGHNSTIFLTGPPLFECVPQIQYSYICFTLTEISRKLGVIMSTFTLVSPCEHLALRNSWGIRILLELGCGILCFELGFLVKFNIIIQSNMAALFGSLF